MIAECLMKDGSYKEEEVYTWDSIPLQRYLHCGEVGKKKVILNVVSAFDIETTSIDCDQPYGFMYLWQFCIENHVCMGRTWNEFLLFLQRLKNVFNLNEKRKFVIYVHNLSFEFQFLSSFVNFTNIFAKDKRKVLKCEIDSCIEFRCSLALSNKPLFRFLKDSDVDYVKGVGDLDYSVIRTPSTVLKPKELGYAYNDVRGLVQAIKTKLVDDDLRTIPLTSTGYVRRNCRNAMRKNPNNRKQFKSFSLNEDTYNLCMKLRRGGNTHAYRAIVGKKLHNIRNFDISSSYPFVMLCCYFPMEKFTPIKVKNMRQVKLLLNTYCCMFTVSFKGLTLKNHVPIPYIPVSKCEQIKEFTQFTGRVLEAEELTISMTEIDWNIIMEQYDYKEIAFHCFYIAKRGELPEELKEEIREYFQGKSELKKSDPYLYAKYKELLNAIFGMTMTDPIHDEYVWNGSEFWDAIPEEEEKTLSEKLEDYYNSRNAFLTLQWSCWVTAHARKRLQDIIDITGMGTLYCDTDSDKCQILDESVIEKINELNKQTIIIAEQYRAYAVVDGKKIYMGVYEEEDPYDEFKTYGPKKYAYVQYKYKNIGDGLNEYYSLRRKELHITIAGVNKKYGAMDLGTIDNFKLGYKFNKIYDGISSGGNAVWYNDCPVHYITVNGEKIITGSNIAVLPSEYTLGITEEYLELLDFNIDNLIYT